MTALVALPAAADIKLLVIDYRLGCNHLLLKTAAHWARRRSIDLLVTAHGQSSVRRLLWVSKNLRQNERIGLEQVWRIGGEPDVAPGPDALGAGIHREVDTESYEHSSSVFRRIRFNRRVNIRSNAELWVWTCQCPQNGHR